MGESVSLRVRIQKVGTFLSSMVMPNIGVFIAWGFLTALFIPTGWMPNEDLNNLVGPTLKYLIPVLIGYTGGTIIHGRRGGAVGAAATMGGSYRCRYHDADRRYDHGSASCLFNEAS